MSYKIRPGIVHIKICGTDLLVATRPLWESCPQIRKIPKLWAACWTVMELDPENTTDQDVMNTFSNLMKLPLEETRKQFGKVFKTLSEEGFLIETGEKVL